MTEKFWNLVDCIWDNKLKDSGNMTLDRTRISALKGVINQQLVFHTTEGYTILAILSTASLTSPKFTHSVVSIIVDA
jgi:hypothetical protein